MKHSLSVQEDGTVICSACGKDSLYDGNKWTKTSCEAKQVEIQQGRANKEARLEFFKEIGNERNTSKK